MAKQNKKFESFVSAKGVAVWPHLNSADTEYDDRGLFHTKLAYDPEKPADAAFLSGLEERLEAHVEEVTADLPPAKAKKITKNPIVRDEEDRDTGEATGRKLVSFKMYASSTKDGVTKTREPRFFDAKGSRIPAGKVPNIGAGSELKIEYSVGTYNTPKGTGITLYLNNVQIIKLVEFSGGGTSKFGAEEGGFSADDIEDNESMADASEESGKQEDGDF